MSPSTEPDPRGTPAGRGAWPTLTEEQLARLVRAGRTRAADDGDVLIPAGTADYPLLVVLGGSVRIVERQPGDGTELLIARHEAGTFVGDVDLLSGRPAVFTAIAEGDCRFAELTRQQAHAVVAADAGLGETLLRAFLVRRDLLAGTGAAGTRLIGSRWSRQTFELKELLDRNGVPHTWLDPERSADTERLLRSLGVEAAETPLVMTTDGRVLRRPSASDVTAALGLRRTAGPGRAPQVHDVLIVGAGPAGLAAAVYAASEGLDVLVVDGHAPGGQAGTSSKIENYLGFPTGVSGGELARRAVTQAQKFGADLHSGCRAVALVPAPDAGGLTTVRLEDGGALSARCVLIATGARYRRLGLANEAAFAGTGVYYGATRMEAVHCRDETVIVVGGGNSAGQAAVFLSGQAERVLMLVRGDSLADSMSRYLVERLEATPSIELRYRTRVAALHGDESAGRFEAATLTTPSGDERVEVAGVFVMIGADPCTDWLRDVLALDDRGFVLTGPPAVNAAGEAGFGAWPMSRPPHDLETNRPGVFAAGDVRHDSTKRVATAVGEGAAVVRFFHAALSADASR